MQVVCRQARSSQSGKIISAVFSLNPRQEYYGSTSFPQKAQLAGAVLTPGLSLSVTLVTALEREGLGQLLP